jgi:hypothetical protein
LHLPAGWLQNDGASFDRLRMRRNENGIYQVPQRNFLILSLSKDAREALQQTFTA